MYSYLYISTEIVRSGSYSSGKKNEEDKFIVGCRVVGKRD